MATKTERTPKTNPELTIIKDVSGNPRREGSWGHQSFSLIKTGMTVAKFVENGGRMQDLQFDIKAGHCHLAKKASKKA